MRRFLKAVLNRLTPQLSVVISQPYPQSEVEPVPESMMHQIPDALTVGIPMFMYVIPPSAVEAFEIPLPANSRLIFSSHRLRLEHIDLHTCDPKSETDVH